MPAALLSITMPARNRPELLERALRSVLAAVEPVAEDIEVAVSDGSDDEATGAVCGGSWPARCRWMVGYLGNVAGLGDMGVFAMTACAGPTTAAAPGPASPGRAGPQPSLPDRPLAAGATGSACPWPAWTGAQPTPTAPPSGVAGRHRPGAAGGRARHVASMLGDEHPPAQLEGNFHLRSNRRSILKIEH
jgi:hypothetical protein